jgi:hypothetical protein
MSPDGDPSHRLAILMASEIDDRFGLPCFTDEDRRLYFDLSAVERIHLRSVSAFRAATRLLQSQAAVLHL